MSGALKEALAREARALGFDCIGVTAPDAITEAARHFHDFLASGAHGDMDWLAQNPERRADPRALWSEVRSVIMLGINYGPDRAHTWRDFGLCPGRRLSRAGQEAAEGSGALAGRGQGLRGQSVRRYRGGDGETVGAGGGPRLARQAHQPGVARVRVLAVSRRDLHHARPAGRRRGGRSLRLLPGLPRHLPDRGIS